MTDLVPIPPMRPEPERDSYGRYVLPDPSTGRRTSWTRATTLKGALTDKEGLIGWKQRLAAVGMARLPHLGEQVLKLQEEITACGKDWRAAKDPKDAMKAILAELHHAAGGDEGSERGTQAHTLTEYADAGRLDEVRHLATESELADLGAYLAKCAEAGIVRPPRWIERVVVNLTVESAGTFDRLVHLADGRLVCADVKGLALTTPLPTPSGWTTMGAVEPGDQVFDAFGVPCTVTAKSLVKQIGTYVVRFDDGSEIVCDTEHIWWTSSGRTPGPVHPRPIAEVIETLTGLNGKQHRVPVARPLVLPDVDLPIEPYLLGCWLGNGDSGGGVICSMPDLFETMEGERVVFGKETPSPKSKAVRRTALGLRTQLRQVGLLGHKLIPDIYLRASIAQRMRLLQGLMDTDGTWNKPRRTATFYTVRKALALQVTELLASLGQRPNMAGVPTTGFGKRVISYHVSFTPVDLQPFILPRKADQAAASTKSTKWSRRRVIVSVEPGPDVATACIAVDSPSRTYLCGDRMIPTHNSQQDFDFGFLDAAAQMGQYVNADAVWDHETRTWSPLPDELDREVGLVMHVPVGQATCDLYEVDLREGWEAAQIAYQVRAKRSRSKVMGWPYTHRALPARLNDTSVEQDLYLIRNAGHPDALIALWRDLSGRGCWTELHTQEAAARKAQLISTHR